MDRRRTDDGSPGRIIATMVGIVGIVLLGSLFWSAMGSLLGAFGQVTQSIPVNRPPLSLALEPTLTPLATATAAPLVLSPTPRPTAMPTPEPTRQPTSAPTAVPTIAPTAAPTASGRSPWVLLPQPAPGSKVAPGAITLEARARGDAPIDDIQLEIDGAAVKASVEQRGEGTWRGVASVRVGPGSHNVRAVVVDAEGRRGSYRWTFEAAP